MQRRRTLPWVVVALVAFDLIFFSGASNYLASPQARILDQLLVLGAGLAVLRVAARGSIDLRTPLLLPGLAWIAATMVATLTSQRPEASREALALLLLAAPAYWLVRAILADPWWRSRVDGLLVLFTAGFVVAYLVQALLQWLAWWSVAGPSVPPLRPGDVGLSVGTVNSVALYLELLVPLALWIAWTRSRSRRLVVALGTLSLVALIVTGSRGAWLGALAGLGALIVTAWVAGGRVLPQAVRLGRRPTLLVVAVVVVGLVIFGPILLTRLAGGDAGRFELWSAAWSMFTAHPLTGAGPGAWQGLRALTPISQTNLAVLFTTHDSVLQILAETGLLGLGAALWLVGAVAALGWRAVRAAPAGVARGLPLVVLATLIAFVVHSLVDTQMHVPAVVLLVLLLVARLDPPAAAARPEPGPRAASRLVLGSAAVPLVFAVLLLVPIDVAMVRGAFGDMFLAKGNATAALAEFDAAVALHDLPIYRLGQAIARSGVGDRAGALASLQRVDDREPFTFVAAAQATVLDQMGMPRLADAFVVRVEALPAYDPTAMLQVAVVRAHAGNDQAATTDLAATMAAVPPLIHSRPPAGLFSSSVWVAAQHQALGSIRTVDPVTAAAEAIQAHLPDEVASSRALISDPAPLELLDILAVAADGGTPDLARMRVLLRAGVESPTIQILAWTIGFAAKSQPDIDAVARVSTAMLFGVPIPPVEIVVDGRTTADWSLRLLRYPSAASSRTGPDRPYVAGAVTIEPVYRPK